MTTGNRAGGVGVNRGASSAAVNDLFLQLTPDKILDAVEVGGLRATGRAMQLNSYENRVYDVEMEDESHRVLKFYRPGRWSREAIQDEHRFLRALLADGMPVAAAEPLRPADPESTLGEIAGILYASFPKVRGRLLLADELSDDLLRSIGRLLGRLHNVGEEEAAPHRPRLLPGSYALDELDFLCARFVPLGLATRYRAAAARVANAAAALAELPVLRIHGDCHLGNLLFTSSGPCFVDFDDFLNGPAVQDLWLLAGGDADRFAERLAALCEGYEDLRHLPRGSLQLCEALRGLRMLRYAAWLGHRYHDPAFQRAFPDFESERFWQREVDDLERQVARLP